MPPRSAIGQLPEEIRDELNRRLVASGFAGYKDLSCWLEEQGYKISKSAVHRHGSELEAEFDEAMADVRRTRALAKAVGTDGDDGEMLGATSGILQDQLLRISIALRKADSDPAEAAKIISTVARAHADVGRMQIGLSKWQAELRAKAAAVAANVDALARQEGMSEATLESIKRGILGLAG